MTNPITNLLIHPESTLLDALEVIQTGQRQLALVVDDFQRLLGLITDGDARRALLSGKTLEMHASEIMHRNFIKADISTSREEIFRLMKKKRVTHIPVVDDGKVVDLVWLNELVLNDKELDLQAVIMAGGTGKRLRPLTDKTPKPLLHVGKKPLAQRIVESLTRQGINTITFAICYKAEQFREYFGNGDQYQAQIDYLLEENPRGTAGGLSLLTDKGRPALVINGDILTQVDFKAMYHFHVENDSFLTVAVQHYSHNVPFGVVVCDGTKIKTIKEKPTYNHLVNAGIYILSPKALAMIPDEGFFDMTDLIQSCLQRQLLVTGFPIATYWLDIGKMDDYAKALDEVKALR